MISIRSIRSLRSKADKQAKLAAKTNDETDHRLLFHYLTDLRAAEEAANTEESTASNTETTALTASNETTGIAGPFDIIGLIKASFGSPSLLVFIIGLVAQLSSNEIVFLAGLSITLLYFRQHVATQVLSIFNLLKQQQQRQQEPRSFRQAATDESDARRGVFETLGLFFGLIAFVCSLPFMSIFLCGAAFFTTVYPMIGFQAGFLTLEMSIFYLHYCGPLNDLFRSPFRMLLSFWILANIFLFFCGTIFLISEHPVIGSLAVFTCLMATATLIFSMLNDQEKKPQFDVSTIAGNQY